MGCESSKPDSEPLSPTAASESSWSELTLVRKTHETPDAWRLVFQLPKDSDGHGIPLSRDLMYTAFLSLKDATGNEISRPYTPVSVPHEDRATGEVIFLIKMYPSALFGGAVALLEPGMTCKCKMSIAKLDLASSTFKKVALLAGGTGVTPMIQAARYLLNPSQHAIPGSRTLALGARPAADSIVLIHWAHTLDDFIMRDEIDELARSSNGRFVVRRIIHDSAERQDTPALLRSSLPAPAEDVKVLVCGPDAFYAGISGPRGEPTVSGVLADLGYTAEMVHKC